MILNKRKFILSFLCLVTINLTACSTLNAPSPANKALKAELKTQISEQFKAYQADTKMSCQAALERVEQQLTQQQANSEHLIKTADKIEYKLNQHQTKPHPKPASNCPEPTVIEQKLNGKVIVGELEWVYFSVVDEHFRARVDSGATTSSLSAKHIVEFERDGENWVRFQLLHQVTDLEGREIEAKIERTVRIRQSSSDKTERRHVVQLSVHLGKLHQMAEFTLADRSDMDYPILLGREFLQDITLIDVGQTYVHPKYKKSDNK